MKLAERPLTGLLEAFRSPSPTPGGGSAAALAGALGASLLAMVAALPRHRAATQEDVERLQAAGRRCTDVALRMTALVDEDAAAYDAVVAAYRLPKASEQEKAARRAAVQAALGGAIAVPLEVMRRCADAIEAGPVVASFGHAGASSDAAAGLELLAAAARAARLNVDVNVAGLDDAAGADRVRRESAELASACETGARAALGDLPPAR
jgi:formiminotetrahydrofolate cyclodeaminase